MNKHERNIAVLLSNQTERRISKEEHRRKAKRQEATINVICWCLVIILLVIIAAVNRVSLHQNTEQGRLTAMQTAFTVGRLPGDDAPAAECCYLDVEEAENELIQAAMLERANVIENCTVTWYTNGTCGKKPGDSAYGITASGLPTVEGLTCAVDKRVIPLYSDVFVQFSDGTIQQYWATDTGVRGNHIDIYEPDYDTCIQNGRQTLKVWWCEK